MTKAERKAERAVCRNCGGTGWLHGCQRWTPAQMRKGTPYYSERCSCSRLSAARAAGKKRNGKGK